MNYSTTHERARLANRMSAGRIGIAFGAALTGSSLASAQCSSNAGQQFSVVSNPNGQWTYLYVAETKGDPALMFVVPNSDCSWTGGLGPFGEYPDIQRCPSPSFSITVDEVLMSPGPEAAATLRWTAPTAGEWTIDLTHRGVWPSPLVDADLILKVDGTTLYSAVLKPSVFPPESWSSTEVLAAGSFVEFSIEAGANGIQDWDRVAASLTFSHGPVFGDVNQDCKVNGVDLGTLLGAWGTCQRCAADLNGDGVVNGADLGGLLSAWTG